MNSLKYQETVKVFAEDVQKTFHHDPALLARANAAAVLAVMAICKAMHSSRLVA